MRRTFDAEALACALVPAAALTLSGLVQPASEYMAFATVGFAFAARCLIDRRESSTCVLTLAVPRAVAALAAAYLGWAAVTAPLSSDRRTSAVYLAGATLALVIAFWAMPPALGRERGRRRFLATVVVVALGAVGVTVVLAITGPAWLYGA